MGMRTNQSMLWTGIQGEPGLGQAPPGGVGGGLSAVNGVDLVQDVTHVGSHGSDPDDKLPSDLAVGPSGTSPNGLR